MTPFGYDLESPARDEQRRASAAPDVVALTGDGSPEPEEVTPPAGDSADTGTAEATGADTQLPVSGPEADTGTVEADTAATAAEPAGYDPAGDTVEGVLAYVAAHPDEKAAVLASEEQGRARKGILSALAE